MYIKFKSTTGVRIETTETVWLGSDLRMLPTYTKKPMAENRGVHFWLLLLLFNLAVGILAVTCNKTSWRQQEQWEQPNFIHTQIWRDESWVLKDPYLFSRNYYEKPLHGLGIDFCYKLPSLLHLRHPNLFCATAVMLALLHSSRCPLLTLWMHAGAQSASWGSLTAEDTLPLSRFFCGMQHCLCSVSSLYALLVFAFMMPRQQPSSLCSVWTLSEKLCIFQLPVAKGRGNFFSLLIHISSHGKQEILQKLDTSCSSGWQKKRKLKIEKSSAQNWTVFRIESRVN